jgi:adenine-specific DNA-methyltransferase
LIARAAQLPGALLTRADGRALLEAEDVFLLRLKSQALDREDSALGRYLRRGRRLGIHLRYKCRVRSPWYSVPGVRIPDAFMSYMSHRAPRIALNEAGFGSTNLVHHVNFHLTSRPIAAAVIAALHSSVALLSFEIEGRSYGGGVLKHETKEAERVELPALEGRLATRLGNALPEIDSALRGGGPDAAATVADIVLVSEGVLTTDDLASLMSSREELRDRRATRGRTST